MDTIASVPNTNIHVDITDTDIKTDTNSADNSTNNTATNVSTTSFGTITTDITSSNTTIATANFDNTSTVTGDCSIAVLLIIVDDVPFENIWRLWVEQHERQQQRSISSVHGCSTDNSTIPIPITTSTPSVQFFIHAKNPERIKSVWIKKHLVKSFHLRPAWGSLELTEVMMLMLQEVSSADVVYSSSDSSEDNDSRSGMVVMQEN